jgi:hypothetical protein
MHILERYSSVPAPLQAVFEALPDEPIKPTEPLGPEPVPTGRLANGEVKRSIVKLLAAADGPMRAVDIYLAVKCLLGRSVPKDSVYACLSKGARGKAARFERVGEGCYRLIQP